MKDLKQMMIEAFDNINKSGLIEKTVQSTMEKTIESIVGGLFREYSEFGRDIEKAIKKSLKINADDLNFKDYSSEISKMVRSVIKGKLDKNLKAEVDRFLVTLESNDIPAEIKISNLIDKLVEFWVDSDEDLRQGFEFSLHVVQRWPDDHCLRDCCAIYIDKDPDKVPRDCDIQIEFSKRDMLISGVNAYHKNCNNTLMMTTSQYGEMGYLFKLYSSKAKLIDDSASIDSYINEREDYW